MLGPWIVTLSQDENEWCALLGDNLQEGISGFGRTPAEALQSLARKINSFHRWEDIEKINNGQEDADTHYRTHVVCGNCGWEGQVNIIKSIEVKCRLCPCCHCAHLRTSEA